MIYITFIILPASLLLIFGLDSAIYYITTDTLLFYYDAHYNNQGNLNLFKISIL